MRKTPLLLVALLLAACQPRAGAPAGGAPAVVQAAGPAGAGGRQVRASGAVKAVREVTVRTPQIHGQVGRLTIVSILPTGSRVAAGDVLVEFDRVLQLDNSRDAQARLDDFQYQIVQRQAENDANTEARDSEMESAQAVLAKAELQLRRNETLSQIDREKNATRAAAARERMASLKKSQADRNEVDAAVLRILELRRDRYALALKRAQTNAERLLIRAPHAGMVALESIWRGNTQGPAQEGDQIFPGQALLRLFDPAEMEVHVFLGEPDGAILTPQAHAEVRFDAYPELTLPARFLSASPVATADFASPVKRFAARFLIEKGDARLLPNLSAAVVIESPARGEARP